MAKSPSVNCQVLLNSTFQCSFLLQAYLEVCHNGCSSGPGKAQEVAEPCRHNQEAPAAPQVSAALHAAPAEAQQ